MGRPWGAPPPAPPHRTTGGWAPPSAPHIIPTARGPAPRLFRFQREQTRDELPERPQERSGRLEERVVLIDALLRLPKRQRAAVVLRYWEDMPGEQVAHVLGCSAGAARNLTMRGLASLRELLSAETLELFEGVPS